MCKVDVTAYIYKTADELKRNEPKVGRKAIEKAQKASKAAAEASEKKEEPKA
jgi:hypothetical protein